MELVSGSHSIGQNLYHLEWCPKYRYNMFRGKGNKKLCEDILHEVAARHNIGMIELSVMPDHIHLFVSAAPENSPARIIQVIKSITAREVFHRFPSVKRLLWGGALWERGYFVMSSGTGTTDEMIRRYIHEQRQPSEANDGPNLFGP